MTVRILFIVLAATVQGVLGDCVNASCDSTGLVQLMGSRLASKQSPTPQQIKQQEDEAAAEIAEEQEIEQKEANQAVTTTVKGDVHKDSGDDDPDVVEPTDVFIIRPRSHVKSEPHWR